jgi:hypothetical protein
MDTILQNACMAILFMSYGAMNLSKWRKVCPREE